MKLDEKVQKIYDAYRHVFSTPSGREVLIDLYHSFGKRSSFIQGSPDGTAFREGERAVYLRIARMASIDLHEFEQAVLNKNKDSE